MTEGEGAKRSLTRDSPECVMTEPAYLFTDTFDRRHIGISGYDQRRML
jgi:hypothetical protein